MIRRHDTVLDYTWTGTGSDGKTETFSYSGPVDGKEQKLPGDSGLRGAMIPTPDGVIEGKLWFPGGGVEDKYCILTSPKRLTCFATFTDSAGKASLFKEVFDKQCSLPKASSAFGFAAHYPAGRCPKECSPPTSVCRHTSAACC